MNLDDFYSRLTFARLRASQLCLRMWQSIAHQQQLLVECLEELHAALKYLELAYEALSQQNNELATAYELVEVERQRYQDLFELVPNPYLVTNKKGIIQEANKPAATLLNVPQKFLVGKPLAMFVLQKERRAFIVKLTELHQENLGQEWEVRLQPRNSNSIDASLSVTTVGDREGRRLMLGWMLRDITEYNRVAKSELRLFRDAVQQANAPIVITSAELNEPGPKIVFVNSAFTQMTGYSMKEIINQTPRILHGDRTERSVLKQLRRRLSQGQPFDTEITNYRKDGTEYKVQIYCSAIRNDRKQITHFISIQHPLTLPIAQTICT